MTTIVDPPSGWKYGFPKPFTWKKEEETIEEWFIKEGYPKKDVDLAVNWSRYWVDHGDL